MQKKFDPKVFQLGYVALGTPDIERTKQHYLKNLGMTEVARDGDGSVYLSIGYNHHDLVLRPAAQKALLHEFAHAYQLEQWPEHQPDIQSAWEHARDSGRSRTVRDVETGKTVDSAYVLVNQLEYFAELSCMYFAKCNYQPTNREELKAHDPVGHAMIRKLWRPEK